MRNRDPQAAHSYHFPEQLWLDNMPACAGMSSEGVITMNEIKLDPKKLLGFKIIADGSVAKLSSPKIGDKGCTVHADALSPSAALHAKIGAKTD
jgi:hypothetical protein